MTRAPRLPDRDLLELERLPLDLAGRFPAMRKAAPERGARQAPRAAPELLLVGPGGLSRLASAEAKDPAAG